jgi:hypothetical protein
MTIAPPEPSDALDDAELALAAAGGNQLAFSTIYDRYADRLYDFCVGMLATAVLRPTACKTCSSPRQPNWCSFRIRIGCGRGCMRSPGTRRWRSA